MITRRSLIQLASAVALGKWVQPSMAEPADPKPQRLVFIHGRSQQGHNPKQLQADWMAALKRGAISAGRKVPDSIQVSFPFYGDQLDAFEKASRIPVTQDVAARGDEEKDFLAFQVEVAQEIQAGAHISDDTVKQLYRGDPQERGVLNWKWVQAILRAIDMHGGGLNRKALELFTHDVYLYCTQAGIQDAINHTVAKVLSEEPTVIVAHSLGTVVAYRILSTDMRNLKIPLLVTLGCPLGVHAISNKLAPVHSPDPVGHWYNAFDTSDVVALYPLDDTNFRVDPSIENNNSVTNHTDNHHGIEGYLDDKVVAARVIDGLGG
jgi:hypothetical protein